MYRQSITKVSLEYDQNCTKRIDGVPSSSVMFSSILPCHPQMTREALVVSPDCSSQLCLDCVSDCDGCNACGACRLLQKACDKGKKFVFGWVTLKTNYWQWIFKSFYHWAFIVGGFIQQLPLGECWDPASNIRAVNGCNLILPKVKGPT